MPFPVSVSVPAAAGPRPLGLNEHIYLPIYLPLFSRLYLAYTSTYPISDHPS